MTATAAPIKTEHPLRSAAATMRLRSAGFTVEPYVPDPLTGTVVTRDVYDSAGEWCGTWDTEWRGGVVSGQGTPYSDPLTWAAAIIANHPTML